VALYAARGVLAQGCQAFGVDFANGGAYYIDGGSNQYFSFITVFQGCQSETISPILVDPQDNQYACSNINTTPANQQVTSTCGIPYSAMSSGTWKIVLQGRQVSTQRAITLTVGVPVTSTVTVTPTIVLGITSTPAARTVFNTLQYTQTLILAPGTVTANCNSATQTVTNYPRGPTITSTTTVLRTATDGARTSVYTTTASSQAVCHYPQKKRAVVDVTFVTEEKRAAGAVAAVTVTVTQTTYTYTQTVVTTIPARTTTEIVMRTITATVSPPAATVCNGQGRPSVTVTINKPTTTATQTNVVYQTTHLSGTVWVGTTVYTTFSNAASATACWRAGGWYGV
jgi:hypothetical protein